MAEIMPMHYVYIFMASRRKRVFCLGTEKQQTIPQMTLNGGHDFHAVRMAPLHMWPDTCWSSIPPITWCLGIMYSHGPCMALNGGSVEEGEGG